MCCSRPIEPAGRAERLLIRSNSTHLHSMLSACTAFGPSDALLGHSVTNACAAAVPWPLAFTAATRDAPVVCVCVGLCVYVLV